MKKFDWKDTDLGDIAYYYNTADGKIHGQVHKIAHTKIWLAKIINDNNEEKFLGQYISEKFSKQSVVEYWLIQERTLIGQ